MSDTENTSLAPVRSTIDLATLDAPDTVLAKCEQLAANMAGVVEGYEGNSRKWRAPLLKIVQPVTQDPAKPEDAKNGDLFSKAGAPAKPLRGVIAYVWYSRSFFHEDAGSCWSDNVDTGARTKTEDRSINAYGEPCKDCKLNVHPREALAKDAKGKPVQRKLCQNITNVVFVPETMDGPYHIQFKGASAAAGRQLVDMAKAHGVPWSKMFSLDTEQKKRDGGGLYYVFKATPVAAPVPAWLKTVAISVSAYVKEMREEDKTATRTRSNDVAAVVETETISDGEVEVIAAKKGFKEEF